MNPLSAILVLTLFQAGLAAQTPATKSEIPLIYTLGPDDQIVIRAVDAEEIDNKPVRIDNRGNINLPTVGRIAAAGLTTDQLEVEIAKRLKKYINEPDVTVSLFESHSQPVSVLGSVQTPGVLQLQGQKTLFEVLSLAGGLRADAGNTVKITRHLEWGRIPFPTAADDASGHFSVVSLQVKDILNATDPQENITIKPNDVISVPRADIIYVIGAVKKAGGFALGENAALSALQVLSLAEGLERFAKPEDAKIMRNVPGTSNRTEIPVDLKRILAGKSSDVPLKADDILFIPSSVAKSAAVRSMEAAIAIGTGLAIYRVQ